MEIPAKNRASKLAVFLGKRLVPLTTMCALVALVMIAGLASYSAYAINDDGKTVLVETFTPAAPEKALELAGIKLGKYDSYKTVDNSLIHTIKITRAKPVTITADGKAQTLYTIGETVSEILDRADITLGNMDIVNYGTAAIVDGGETISVSRRHIEYVNETKQIPYITMMSKSSDYYVGTTKTLSEGSNGEKKLTYATIVQDGEITSRDLVSDVTLKSVVNESIVEGARQKPVAPKAPSTKTQSYLSGGSSGGQSVASSSGGSGTVTTHDGLSLSYSNVLTCKATAYYEAPEVAITAMGTTPHWGVIAVDPRVIPLGTRVYITNSSGSWEYGVASCEDTGGAIKGKKVDLFMNSIAQCFSYGVGTVKVYILS